MRLLFINQYYWPDEAATAQLLADLAEDLAAAGHEVTVLCGRGRYSCKVVPADGKSLHRGVHIQRVWGTDWGRFSFFGRILDMATFMIAAAWVLAWLPRKDAVVSMTSPPLVSELALRYHRRTGASMMLWVQDIYPDIAEKLGALRNPLLRWLLRYRVRKMYDASSVMIVPGEDMRMTLRKYVREPNRIHVVPNWTDLDLIRCTPVSGNSFRHAQGWGDERIIMYSGNLGAAHELDAMGDLLGFLQNKIDGLRLVLVGDSPRHRQFAAQVRAKGFERLTELPFQSRQDLGDLLGAADVHLISQRLEVDGLLVPSKFYGAVAAGRPVLFVGSRTCELGRLISDHCLGLVVTPGTPFTGVEAQLRELFAESAGGAPEVERRRAWASKHASRAVRTREMASLLESGRKP